MSRKTVSTACLLGAIAMIGVRAHTAPQPAEVPVTWQLEFSYPAPPRPIRIRVPGQREPETFWYFRYRVTNLTEEDRTFVPEFALYTDTGQLIRAGQGVPTTVFDRIKQIHNDVLLTDITGMTGKLLQGEDNAKDGVAIFRDFDPQAGMFDLFVGGLSGEIVEVELPTPVRVADVNVLTGERISVLRNEVVLSRTLRLRYAVPGEAAARFNTPARLIERDWVMR